MSPKIVAFGLAILGLIVGVAAAYYWREASLVRFEPFEANRDGTPRRLNPFTDPGHWIEAQNLTIDKSGRLNKTAAWLTGCAVILSGASSVIGAWPE